MPTATTLHHPPTPEERRATRAVHARARADAATERAHAAWERDDRPAMDMWLALREFYLRICRRNRLNAEVRAW